MHPPDTFDNGGCPNVGETGGVKRWWALAVLVLLAGCREVRVRTYATGITGVLGSNQVVVARSEEQLERLGIKLPLRFRREFAVVLLMGPHDRSGYRQIVESIGPGIGGVRLVAFEQAPPDGGEPTGTYRTFTVWVLPNNEYARGIRVQVVTPSNEPIASTALP